MSWDKISRKERAIQYQFEQGLSTAYRGFRDLVLLDAPEYQRKAFGAGTRAGMHERALDKVQGATITNEIGC